MPYNTRLSILVAEVREEKRKTGWPALPLIRNPHGMPADDGQACHTSRRAMNGAALLGILTGSIGFSIALKPSETYGEK